MGNICPICPLCPCGMNIPPIGVLTFVRHEYKNDTRQRARADARNSYPALLRKPAKNLNNISRVFVVVQIRTQACG